MRGPCLNLVVVSLEDRLRARVSVIQGSESYRVDYSKYGREINSEFQLSQETLVLIRARCCSHSVVHSYGLGFTPPV